MHTPEYALVQNPCLGAMCLWSFALEYWTQTKRSRGPSIPILTCVLPLAYHNDSVNALHARRLNGGLLSALADDRSLTVGLQERVESMGRQTFESLQMALAARLLALDSESLTVIPTRLSAPDFEKPESFRNMMATAMRLGHWFATLPLEQICNYLRIRL